MSNLLPLERRQKIAGQQESGGRDQNRKKDPDVHLANPPEWLCGFSGPLSRSANFDR
jgi:hypothetical protein